MNNIRLNDDILSRLKIALDILLSQKIYSDEYLMATLSYKNIHVAHYPEYSGDVPGRWILAMTAMEKVMGFQPRLHSIVKQAVKFQCADGHFGRVEQSLETTNRAQIYGNAWMLQGLMSYYEHTGDSEALESAVRLGDYYLRTEAYWINDKEIGKLVTYGHAFGCYTHALEGIVMLYKATGNQDYLEFAGRMAASVEDFDKAVHSHMHLSTLRGMLTLYQLNHDKKLLEKVIDENRRVIESEMLSTGGVYECYGIHYIDEACSVCDFFIVNLRLWEITGETEYRLLAEKIFWNHLLFSQFPEGSFGSLPVNPEFLDKTAVPAYWCCAMYGANILAANPEYSVSVDGKLINVSLLFGGEFTVMVENVPVTVSLDADYYRTSKIVVEINAPQSITATLRLYLPANTRVISQTKTVDYVELTLDNSRNAEFELEVHALLRYEAAETVMSPDGKFKILHDAVFYRGPQLLCQSSPMLKKRGHFILIAEKPDKTFEFIDTKQHRLFTPEFRPDIEEKVNYMRLTGDAIEKNINSPSDIYSTTMCPVGDFTWEQCKVSYDVVAIPREQAEQMIKTENDRA